MTIKDDLKSGTLHLSNLPSAKRARVKRFLTGDKRALRKRDKVLGLRFASEDIAAWSAMAEGQDVSITEWIEQVLNEKAGRK